MRRLQSDAFDKSKASEILTTQSKVDNYDIRLMLQERLVAGCSITGLNDSDFIGAFEKKTTSRNDDWMVVDKKNSTHRANSVTGAHQLRTYLHQGSGLSRSLGERRAAIDLINLSYFKGREECPGFAGTIALLPQ